MPRKGRSDYRSLSGQHVRSISDESLSNSRNVVNEFEAPYQFDRKEKFRMVIGGAKKDSGNSSSKPVKPPGLTAEETAAVVMAATRGLSNKSTSDTIRKRSVDDMHTVSKVVGNSHSSSLGSFPPMPGKHWISKAASDGKAGNFLPDGFYRDTGKHGKESINASSGVLVANAIAKTVAGEADSSDACLTKEQKLKAERLRRAKMFTALVKCGRHKSTELSPTLVGHGGSDMAAGSSVLSGQELDLSRERECSSVPDVAETSDSGGKFHGASAYDSKRRNPTEKDETDRTHSMGKKVSRRKQHHSRHSSRSSGHVHKHKRHRSHRRKDFDSSDSDREDSDTSGDKQQMKHQPPNRKHSDDYEPKKSSRSGRRHEPSRSDDDENQERRPKKSRREESQNLRNKGSSVTSSAAKQASPQLRGDIREVAQPSVSGGASSSPATEVPDDLRAKIRAMLLETL